ncbi:DUF998 domain-containing protein, partial [Tomitella biformata]
MGAVEREIAYPAARQSSRAGPHRWVLATATLSPIMLIGGWLLAGRLQDSGFSPMQQSVSFLASYGAQHRYVMTGALLAVGCLNTATACGLTGVRASARIVLAIAGASTALVAAFPQPVNGTSTAHMVSAVSGAVLLTLWAGLASAPARVHPSLITSRGAVAAAILISISVVALFAAAQLDNYVGLCERICTSIQTTWPLVIALTLRQYCFGNEKGPAPKGAGPSPKNV